MTENFLRCLEFVLRWEGGYSNDPDDPGKETKWGISKKAHPGLDIANLTKEKASHIYLTDYWTPANCDNLPWPDDLVVFDTAVNMGLRRALVMDQESGDWKEYLLNRSKYYYTLAYKRPGLQKFLRGWMNRIDDLKQECLKG